LVSIVQHVEWVRWKTTHPQDSGRKLCRIRSSQVLACDGPVCHPAM